MTSRRLAASKRGPYRVRQALIWLDRADPCETVAKVREDDPNRTGLLAVLAQWREAIGLNVVRTVREIINVAITHPDFHGCLADSRLEQECDRHQQ